MDKNLRSELRRTLTRNVKLAGLLAEALAGFLGRQPEGADVALYGCGTFAKALIERHPEALSRLDTRFVMSEPGNTTVYCGYPVVSPSTLAADPPHVVVLLSATFAHEMLARLTFLPSERVVTLEAIVEDYGLERLLIKVREAISRHVAVEVERMRRELPEGKELIVFFTQQAPQHMVKTMREACRLGYAVAAVVERAQVTPSISLTHYAGKGYFHSLYEAQFIASLEFLELERALRPMITHAEAGMWSAEPLAYVMEHRTTPIAVEYRDFKQTVFASDADGMAAMRLTPEDYIREMEAQRRVYTLAEGVIMKDAPEILDFLEERYGVRQQNVLRFYHYFSQGLAAPSSVEKFSEKTGETHVVYAGCVVNDPNWHNYPIYKSLLDAGRILADQGIHLTIYNAGDSTGQGYEEYLRLDADCPYFHYNFAVPYDALKDVLPRHDFGWFCFDFSNARENPFFLKITMGSKVFTYLEAGLPVLVSPEQSFIANVIANKLQTGVTVSFNELPQLAQFLAGLDKVRFADNIERAKAEWTYETHAPRLGAFYRGLADTARAGGSHDRDLPCLR
jgi:hypothetical protein